MNTKLPNAKWLESENLQSLFDLLCEGGEEARINGGAVRNSLMGEPVADIDLSTTLLPDNVIKRLEACNIRGIPTGIEHGTVTAIIDKQPYEITTLRADIKTDGRHAQVSFGTDWREDALRRDFTINALYADRNGEVFDPLGGLEDIEKRRVRFIGEAEDRINEDYLRILRFFRFFAWYGRGAPDREGLKACVRLKHLVSGLSAERVWSEFHKLLNAPEPARAILWMRQSGVLSTLLPESEKWGIDAIQRLIQAEGALNWRVDPLLRLMSIIPPQREIIREMCARLKTSRKELTRLEDWADSDTPSANMVQLELSKELYEGSQTGIVDRLRLELARLREVGISNDSALADAASIGKLLDFATSWKPPEFPVKGRDLINLGMQPGEQIGRSLASMEAKWVESGFSMSKPEIIKQFQLE